MDTIVKFEKKHNIHLPEDYKQFLLKYNGGSPKPNEYWDIEGNYSNSVNYFYGFCKCKKVLSLEENINSSVPSQLLVIGDDGSTNLFCLGITQDIFGKIYFIDSGSYPYDKSFPNPGIRKLFNSFSSFIGSLTKIN